MLKTMIVGSLPRPTWLVPPNSMYVSWQLDPDHLKEGQDDAVRLAIAEQETAGMDIVTDGEQRRRHYIWGFVEGLTGVDFQNLVEIETRGNRYGIKVRAAQVIDQLRRPHSILKDSVAFVKAYTNKPVKVTLPGPMTTADTLADAYYKDRRKLAGEIANLLNDEACELAQEGCDIIQFDEPCFNIYLDEVEEWGIGMLEKAAHGVEAKTAVHICYGYGIPAVLEWKKKNSDWGHYGRTLPLLRSSSIEMISVECAASGVDPAVLGEAKGKDLMVGVIDVGTEEVENTEVVADRIRTALKYVPPERLYPSTDCGMIPRGRGTATGKMKALASAAWRIRDELQNPAAT